MLFNSWEFALFLPAVLAAYYMLAHRAQNRLLLAASYVFYGWWDYRFVTLLAFSTTFDFYLARRIDATEDRRRRKRLLVLSCVSNLTLLGVFKYFNFFTDSFAAAAAALGVPLDMPTLRIILPVGISFYTFQSLSYIVDVYRRDLRATGSLVDFALFVSFFPHLVAGPIVRATKLLPQIQMRRAITWDHLSSGVVLILIGLFRKVAIADTVAPFVNEVFARPGTESTANLVIGVYLFAIQIYCDFAGYSEMARGIARLFGIELSENFQQPYFSTSITEFWRRWHISLSTWLRDYLYIPLGGNRHGAAATYRNLMLTMLLGGLWHGANWTFVVWGALHGAYLAGHKLLLGDRRDARADAGGFGLRAAAGLAITLHLVCIAWIFFRAETFGQAWQYLAGIASLRGAPRADLIAVLAAALFMLVPLDLAQRKVRTSTPVLAWPWPVRAAVYAAMVLAMFALRTDESIPFIYFQF
ncbi:MAG TPA: MBOAT family protein [Vicinamibacterales bacterium]|nr:MBOAT family protein [Vicinamibacterales bacterium]